MLVGREPERERISRLLAEARSGRSGALIVCGEAGIGKSALLESAVAQAEDMTVISGLGIESEAEIAFGALHLLFHRQLDRLDALPGPQAEALRAAFGLAGTTAVRDRFLIGAATLTLLAEIAGERPVLGVIDDAQWLDKASLDALLFAARRLSADPIAMLFAFRHEGDRPPTQGIETLRLNALAGADAGRLLDARAPGLAAPIRERILAEAVGNPLAIIEFGTEFESGRPSLDQVGVGPLQVPGRVQEAFREQLTTLPRNTRLILAVAAADETTSVDVILRAAAQVGAGAADLGPAEEARLVAVFGDELTFRHPLIRFAAYQSTPHHERIAVHAALAEALPGDRHADRRAWHRAAAATGPDEEVADELERAARRAVDRGGAMAVAAAYERAARLSTDAAGRARRIVNAARAAYDAGRPAWATRLAAEAASTTDDDRLVAEATFIRAQVEYELTSPEADARLALDAAEIISGSDAEAAASMLTEAAFAARDAGSHELLMRGVKRLSELELPDGSELRPLAEGLVGWGRLFDGRPDAAVPPLRTLVGAAREGAVRGYLERLAAGFTGLLIAADDDSATLVESLTADMRAEGGLAWLTYGLEVLAIGRLLRGEFRDAEASVAEGASLASDIGMDMQSTIFDAITIWLAAIFGEEDRCRSLVDGTLARAAPHPTITALANWGLGLLDLADGRASAAADRLDGVCGGPARYDIMIRAVPDHVEAAVRSGRADLGRRHLPAFDRWAEATGGDAVRALSHRCHALLSADSTHTTDSDAADDGEVEKDFVAALALHRDGGELRPYDEARTRLAYGEWLRRRRRRSEARAELTRARDGFDGMGASGWAARARAEIEALGGPSQASPTDRDPRGRLTPQELQVVRLAAAGYSNREIAAQLFLSPRTIGHHLYNAFPKIGVSRRIELTQLDL